MQSVQVSKTCTGIGVPKPEITIQSEMDRNLDNGYIFRVRSITSDGKIYGDIRFGSNSRGPVPLTMDYYLNPDHSTNLEFDPIRDLVVGAESYELLTAP